MNSQFKRATQLATLLVLGAVWMPSALADCLEAFQTKYPTSTSDSASCALCHSSIPSRNPYGTAFSSNGGCRNASTAFTAIENLDSDGDGVINIDEINAGTYPGVADAPANNPPLAVAGGPYTGMAGTAVQFDGSGSTDADNDPLSYAWNFGDGNTGSGVSPSHTYANGGNFSVSLVVNDGKVNSNPSTTTAAIDAPVTNEPPTADAGGPYNGQPGVAVNFDGSGSSDPNSDALTYHWDFGDGATGSGATTSHTYSVGTYTATLTVTEINAGGLSDSATASVSIVVPPANRPPVADVGGPYNNVFSGASYTFNGGGSSDPDGDTLTYAWNFGDGSTGTGQSPAHSYSLAGDYTLSLTVSDGEFSSDPSTTTVTVADPALPTDGEALYANNCAACHGDPWESPAYDEMLVGMVRLAGARECTITASIFGPNAVPMMSGLDSLTADEIGELATYLNSRDATGEQRYVSGCAGCHGPDGSGGSSNENVMGESASEIASAIMEESEMHFLACLPESDLKALGSFLTNADGDNDHDGIDDDIDDDDDNDGIKDDMDSDDDNDDLSDEEEHEHGTNSSDHDSDNDGIDDGDEVNEHHTDPMDNDSDDDGLTDGEEINEYGTDPNDEDTDDDGYSDGTETKVMGTDPLVANTATKTSGGGGGAFGLFLLIGLLASRLFRSSSHRLAP